MILHFYVKSIINSIDHKSIGAIFGIRCIIIIVIQGRLIPPIVKKFGEENTIRFGPFYILLQFQKIQ